MVRVHRLRAALGDENRVAGRQPYGRGAALFWRNEEEHAAGTPPQGIELSIIEEDLRRIREVRSELQAVVASVVDQGRTRRVETEAARLLEFAIDDQPILRREELLDRDRQRSRREARLERLKGQVRRIAERRHRQSDR